MDADTSNEEKKSLNPTTTEDKMQVDPTTTDGKPEDPTEEKPVIVQNFYQRMFSKECLVKESEDEVAPYAIMKAGPCQEPDESSESEVDDEIRQKELEGYKMITPPGCPVCIMNNAESEGEQSVLTPDKIFQILKTYMPLKDALDTFNDMMATTAVTTQAKAHSASSSGYHAGHRLKSKGFVSKMALCAKQYYTEGYCSSSCVRPHACCSSDLLARR